MIALLGIVKDAGADFCEDSFLVSIFGTCWFHVAVFFFDKFIKGPEGIIKGELSFLLSLVRFKDGHWILHVDHTVTFEIQLSCIEGTNPHSNSYTH